MIKFSVTRNGRSVDSRLYNWDELTRTFSTIEDDLVLDFTGMNGVTFKTGSNCIFKTGYSCIFNTSSHCTFKTGSHCTFDIGSSCIFKTGKNCVIIRRDIYEVIKLEKDFNYIKLNSPYTLGYTDF